MRPFARLYFHPASFCGGLRLRFRRGRAFRRQNLHRAVLPRNPRADRLLKKSGGHIDDVPQRGQARIHRNEQPVLLPRDRTGRVVADQPRDGDSAVALGQGITTSRFFNLK